MKIGDQVDIFGYKNSSYKSVIKNIGFATFFTDDGEEFWVEPRIVNGVQKHVSKAHHWVWIELLV